jgi:hypothetical protein
MKTHPVSACDRCVHYLSETQDTRTQPGDAAECTEPKNGLLRTFTLRRAVVQSCAGFAPKWRDAVKLRDVEELPADHAWALWFLREAERQIEIPALGVGPEETASFFDRYIAGDR